MKFKGKLNYGGFVFFTGSYVGTLVNMCFDL